MSNRKHSKAERRTLFARIVAGVLAFLMILSVAYIAIELVIDGFAAPAEEADGYAFASSRDNGDYLVAVALRWGSNLTVSHSFVSPYGFAVGEADIQKEARSFRAVWLTDETALTVACDANLRRTADGMTFASGSKDTEIGGYHVELRLAEAGENLPADLWDALPGLYDVFYTEYEHVFPAYADRERTVRIGAFPDYSSATAAAAAIGASVEGFRVSVVSPSPEGITVLNEDCDEILFEYFGSDTRCGAFCARQRKDADRVYVCFEGNSYLYDGALCFRRYDNGTYNGLTLINLVPLLEYTEGVLPAEVYTTWPIETLKAFAVTVNSFVVSNRNRRFTSYGCDLVASSADQNYRGRTGVTESVIQACREAGNKILVYTNPSTGKTVVADCSYSSSQGGCSVDSKYVWSGSVGGYILSQPTMWEDYASVSWGKWTFEITPQELAGLVKAYNSSLLSGSAVTDVSFETTEDSTYVYSLSLTDDKGKTATVTKCSAVNSLMGAYSHSANFVIAKDSVEFLWDEVISNRIIDLNANYSGYLSVKSAEGVTHNSASLFHFLSGLGKAEKDHSAALYVKTKDGTAVLASEKDIPFNTLPDADGNYTYVSDYGDFLIVSQLRRHTETVKAKKAGNFVIAGKGYGHGVGMSQWGACHLGRAGASFGQILCAYYPGTRLTSFADWWKNS